MVILRDILTPLQQVFAGTAKGDERGTWFVYAVLAVIVHFTCARSSNLLRSLQTLFGLPICQRRFYIFMASPKIPWPKLWCTVWSLIPSPTVDDRLLLVVDDFINPKTGRTIFGCARFFDHAAKINQSRYPWAQNVVSVGLLKVIKGRWAFLPMASRFYHMRKTIEAGLVTVQGKPVCFQSKLDQAQEMITSIARFFYRSPILVVSDSWFGNNGLLKPLRQNLRHRVHLLSRLRSNSNLYDLPVPRPNPRPGRPKKYGRCLGNAASLAGDYRDQARPLRVQLYGKQREILVYSTQAMLKSLQCRVQIVWVYRNAQWVALFSTDLTLSVAQIVEYYGARWKIEAGFKEIKQQLGSSKSQSQSPFAVNNHLQLCMIATIVTWIYADRLDHKPTRCYPHKFRNQYAFNDVRKLITQAALSSNFDSLFPNSRKPKRNSFVDVLVRMVA